MASESEGLAEALQTFQLTWGLDDKCIDFVRCLPENVQSEVIRQFEHRPEQTNPSARCMSFAKKLMQEQSGSESLPQFQAKWGIDDQCAEFLASLPQHVLGTVIANFYQKPEQTNVSARCQAFAQSVLRRQGGGGGAAAAPAASLPPLIAPSLLRAVPMLRAVAEPRLVPPPAHRHQDPLRSLQLWSPSPASVTRLEPPARSAPKGGEDSLVGGDDLVSRLLEFQYRWDLDDTCMDYLGSLSASLQTKLISEFTHRPDQTNPSARCMAFAKKLVQTQPAGEDNSSALASFQAKWGIDDTCMAYLSSMPSHVQATVLNTFEHRPEQTNVSARCQAFARSVLQRSGGSAPQAASYSDILSAAARVVVPSLAARRPAEAASRASILAAAARVIVPSLAAKRPTEALIKPLASGPRVVEALIKPPAGGPRVVPAIVPAAKPVPAPAALAPGPEPADLEQFQAMWGLDDRCIEHLRALPPQVQSIVLAKFEHKPDQTNPSARCQAFAQSIFLRGQQGASALQDFQAKWGVDDRCTELLASMPAHVQAIVTSGFEHRPDQTNVSARCMAYARSVQQRSPPALVGPPLKVQRLV